MWIAGFVTLVLGIVLVICYAYNKRKNARCTAQTQGTLSEIIVHDSDGSPKDVHIYTYDVNGVEYRLRTLDHSREAERVGDACPIWYNPRKPKDAQAYRGTDSYLRIFLIIGLALIPIGIIVFFAGVIFN